MKVLLAKTTETTYAEARICETLRQKLIEYGHQADVAISPACSDPANMMEQILAQRCYQIANACDSLVCFRFPTWFFNHANKYFWLTAYQPFSAQPSSDEPMVSDPYLSEYITRATRAAMAEAEKVYAATGESVPECMNDAGVELLYAPLAGETAYRCDSFGDTIYCHAHAASLPDIDLVLQAMQHTKTGVKAFIAGIPNGSQVKEHIWKRIAEAGLSKKVGVQEETFTEENHIGNLSRCLAVLPAFLPSGTEFHYAVQEAGCCNKPVISCASPDCDLLRHEKSGYWAGRDPKVLARLFDTLFEDKALAEKMGAENGRTVRGLGLSWESIVGRFTN